MARSAGPERRLAPWGAPGRQESPRRASAGPRAAPPTGPHAGAEAAAPSSPWVSRRPWRAPESPQLPLHKRGTRSALKEHTSSTRSGRRRRRQRWTRRRARARRALPPPTLRARARATGASHWLSRRGSAQRLHNQPSCPPTARASAAWARRPPGRREEPRTRAPVPPRGRAWLWAGLYCPPSVVERNQNGFQLVLGEDKKACCGLRREPRPGRTDQLHVDRGT